MKTTELTLVGFLFLQVQTFDVVSVKPSGPDVRGMSVQTSQGRFVARGATLGFLIQYAYRLKPAEIIGGPGWLNTDRFEIEAKTDPDVNRDTDDKVILMLRAALEGRFNLKWHREMREMPIFVLTVAGGGPKLKPAEATRQTGSGGGRPRPAPNTHSLASRGATMANLAAQLSQSLGRSVLDRTGLSGTFDFTLEWSDEVPSTAGGAPDTLPSGPSLFTALQEQLGLKLESSRGPVEVLIVDRAEKPSPN